MLFEQRSNSASLTTVFSFSPCCLWSRRTFEYHRDKAALHRTVKTEPLRGSVVTVTSPPIMRASLRVIGRRPTPGLRRSPKDQVGLLVAELDRPRPCGI